jgi:hypothetical protein
LAEIALRSFYVTLTALVIACTRSRWRRFWLCGGFAIAV